MTIISNHLACFCVLALVFGFYGVLSFVIDFVTFVKARRKK